MIDEETWTSCIEPWFFSFWLCSPFPSLDNRAISLKFCGRACLIRNGVIILALPPHNNYFRLCSAHFFTTTAQTCPDQRGCDLRALPWVSSHPFALGILPTNISNQPWEQKNSKTLVENKSLAWLPDLIFIFIKVPLIVGPPPRLTSFWIISSQNSSIFLKFPQKFSNFHIFPIKFLTSS